jgi:hypothetical protein
MIPLLLLKGSFPAPQDCPLGKVPIRVVRNHIIGLQTCSGSLPGLKGFGPSFRLVYEVGLEKLVLAMTEAVLPPGKAGVKGFPGGLDVMLVGSDCKVRWCFMSSKDIDLPSRCWMFSRLLVHRTKQSRVKRVSRTEAKSLDRSEAAQIPKLLRRIKVSPSARRLSPWCCITYSSARVTNEDQLTDLDSAVRLFPFRESTAQCVPFEKVQG